MIIINTRTVSCFLLVDARHSCVVYLRLKTSVRIRNIEDGYESIIDYLNFKNLLELPQRSDHPSSVGRFGTGSPLDVFIHTTL